MEVILGADKCNTHITNHTMTKQRVSITIRPEVKTALDTYRGDVSRSRTIERILCEYLNLPDKKIGSGGDV